MSSPIWQIQFTLICGPNIPGSYAYCSLQHQSLLLSPVTSTSGHCFHFGSIFSLSLELFLHWSPVAHWAPTDPGSSSFSVIPFLPFNTVHGVLRSRILKWFVIPFSSGQHFVRTLHYKVNDKRKDLSHMLKWFRREEITSKGQKIITVLIKKIDLEFVCFLAFIYRKPSLFFLLGME